MSAAIKYLTRETAPGNRERVFDSIVELAPNPDNPTPMVRLSERLNPKPDFDVLVKLEGMNPFGSIKDRTALHMLRGLSLRDDQALVEPSAGNTGIALAAMANAGGAPIEIAVPDGTPEEKKALLRFLGAGLLEVEDDLCPLFPTEGARGVVKSLVESAAYNGKYVSPNQYENELNVEAHYRTTGPEIWRQTGGRIDAFYASIGTGGTISGVGRFLKEQNPDIRIIGVEPASRQHSLSGIKRITGLPRGPKTCPRWSPDGRWIAYVRGRSSWWRQHYYGSAARDIWVREIDGGTSYRIVHSRYNDDRPMWSSDGGRCTSWP